MTEGPPEPIEGGIQARLDRSEAGDLDIVAELNGVKVTLRLPADADPVDAENLVALFPTVCEKLAVAAQDAPTGAATGLRGEAALKDPRD